MTPKPLILAVETSSRIGSVALAIGPKLLVENTFTGPMKHSAEIFPAICGLLKGLKKKPDEIQQVYISIGPGSFTGLRIAVTIAKTLHLTNKAKIVPVDTLDAIAANVIDIVLTSHESRATSHETIAPILDAKRDQFYTAVYQYTSDEQPASSIEYRASSIEHRVSGIGMWNKVTPDSLMTADEFLNRFADKENPVWLLGDGLLYHKEKFKSDGTCFFDEKFWSPSASKIHTLGWQLALQNKFADPILLTPNYLMRPDIKLKKR